MASRLCAQAARALEAEAPQEEGFTKKGGGANDTPASLVPETLIGSP